MSTADQATHQSDPVSLQQTSGPDLAAALLSAEQGLYQIRRMYREADETRIALALLQTQLEQRAQELTAQAATCAQEQAQLQATRDGIVARERQLSARESQCGDREGKVAADQRALDELSESLSHRAAELEANQVRIASEQHSIAERLHALEARESSLAAATAELKGREQQLAESARTLHAQDTELARRTETLRREEDSFRREMGDAQSLRQSLHAVQQQASQTLKALQDATTRAEQAEEAVLTLREQLNALRSETETTSTTSERRAIEAEEALADAREQIRVRQDAESRLQAAVNDLRVQLETSATDHAELRRQLTEAQSAAPAMPSSVLDELRSKLTASQEAATASGHALAERTKELADARLVIDDLRLQLEQNTKDTGELEGILDQLRDRLRTQAAKAELYAQQVLNLEAQLAEQTHKAAEAIAAASSAAHEAHGAEPQVRVIHQAVSPDEFNRQRKERLGVIRKVLRSREQKVGRASEVLAKRYEQCEQILAMRQDVLVAKRSVDAAYQQQANSVGKSRAAATAFYSVCVLAILACASWLLSGQIAPEVFVARVTLAAESRDRALNEAELGEWQTFHEAMVKDPRFLQFAAGRMERQGIAPLSTPTTLKERLDHDFSVSSNKPGELTLELKGHGPSRLERELQTLAIAVQSQARDAKDRRTDGGNTVIQETAKSSATPIESIRPQYAGGIFGILVLAAGSLAFVVWKRLSQAKLKFEQSTAVDNVDDDARWPTPERKAA